MCDQMREREGERERETGAILVQNGLLLITD